MSIGIKDLQNNIRRRGFVVVVAIAVHNTRAEGERERIVEIY
jgi:hypothetical protein